MTETIRKKMADKLPAFKNRNSDTTPSSDAGNNFYYSTQIIRFITQHVFSLLARGHSLSFENSLEKRKDKQYTGQSQSFYPSLIFPKEWLNIPLVDSAAEIDPKTVEDTLLAIIKEGEITEKFRRIHQIDNIEVVQSVEDFEKYIKELVEDIDDPEDDYLIKGRCEKCNDWNK